MTRNIGIATIPNAVFREGGTKNKSRHRNEDVTFSINFTDDVTKKRGILLGLLDGHEGDSVVLFVKDRISNRLKQTNWSQFIETENDVKEFLSEMIISIDEEFLRKLDDEVRSMENNHSTQPEDDAASMQIITQMEEREKEHICGCSAVIALIFRDKLYVANVGDCHAMLCIRNPGTDDAGSVPLTEQHNLRNDQEMLRLSHDCGLVPQDIRQMRDHGKYDHTRCLGNYRIKREFKTFIYLEKAKSSPVIATPQITQTQSVDPNWVYLVLMSSGLCHLMHELFFDLDKVDGEMEYLIRSAAANGPQDSVGLGKIANSVVKDLASKCYTGYLNLRDAGVEADEDNGFTGHEDLTLLIYRFSSFDPSRYQDHVDPIEGTLEPGSESCQVLTEECLLANSTSSSHSQSAEDSFPFPYVDFTEFEAAFGRLSVSKKERIHLLLEAQSFPEPILEEDVDNSSRITGDVPEPQTMSHKRGFGIEEEDEGSAEASAENVTDHLDDDDIGLMSLPPLSEWK